MDMEQKANLMRALHDLIRQERKTNAQVEAFKAEGNSWGAEVLQDELRKLANNISATSQLFGIDETEARRTFPG